MKKTMKKVVGLWIATLMLAAMLGTMAISALNGLDESMVTLSGNVTYNGTEQKPTVVVDGLNEGTDYEVTFPADMTNAGIKTIVITGLGSYSGTVEKNFVIQAAAPTITVTTSPAEVLVGTEIQITATSEYLTMSDLPDLTITCEVDGTPVAVTEGRVTVPDTAVGGTSVVKITVTSPAEGNYAEATKIVDIPVSEPDYAALIETVQTNLDNAVADLENEDIALDAKITNLTNALDAAKSALEAKDLELVAKDSELAGNIANLETALNTAKTELTTLINNVQTNLDNAVADLENEDIALNTKITNLTTALDTAKAALEAKDAELVAKDAELAGNIANLETALNTAKTELTNLINDVQTNLDNAVDVLEQADIDLGKEIDALEKDLVVAILAYQKADEAIRKDLGASIEAAEAALTEAIEKVAADLAQAREDLEDSDKALDDKIKALDEALKAAEAALKAADSAMKDELQKSIADAKTELNAAVAAGDKANADALAAEAAKLREEIAEAKKDAQIIPIIIGAVAVAGDIALAAWIIVLKRKKLVG